MFKCKKFKIVIMKKSKNPVPKVNEKELMVKMINVLTQALIDINNICINSHESIDKINKNLNISIIKRDNRKEQ